MASGSKKNTKYTYKGNNKKADNKYANIFQDLSEKEEIYKSNALSRIHEKNDGEEVDVDSEELVVRTISAKEAELNAKKRRQTAKNTKKLATRKSSPITESAKRNQFNKQESIEMLKKQKLDEKNKELDDPNLNNGQNTETFDFEGHSLDIDNNTSVEPTEKEITDVSEYIDEDEFIRQKARERAQMDKSKVEIYKEYSDFERVTPKKDVKKKENENKKKNEDKLSVSKENDDSKTKEIKLEDKGNGYIEDKTAIFEIEKAEEKVKAREREIEEILKLKDSTLGENRRNSSANRKERDKTSRSNRNKELSERKARQNKTKINYKKLIGLVVVVLVAVLGVSAAMGKFKNDSTKTKTNNAVTTPKKEDTSKVEEKKETIEDKKRKLEAMRDKLNADEAKRLDYIVENINSYPEALIDQLISNHEIVDFVYSYKDKDKYNEKPIRSGITSSYYVDGDVPLFLQWDRRWGYRPYGKDIIGLTGCGPTSLAMVIKHFDKNADINPYDVAKYSQDNGYISKDNFTSWKLFETGLKKYGLESRDVVPVEAKMKRALDNGQILLVSVKPGIFTQRGHIIVIKGYNSNGDFLINDPNSIINTNKTWSYDELKDQIRKIWAISPIGASSNGEESSNENNTTTDNTNESQNDSNNSSGSADDPSIIQDID